MSWRVLARIGPSHFIRIWTSAWYWSATSPGRGRIGERSCPTLRQFIYTPITLRLLFLSTMNHTLDLIIHTATSGISTVHLPFLTDGINETQIIKFHCRSTSSLRRRSLHPFNIMKYYISLYHNKIGRVGVQYRSYLAKLPAQFSLTPLKMRRLPPQESHCLAHQIARSSCRAKQIQRNCSHR